MENDEPGEPNYRNQRGAWVNRRSSAVWHLSEVNYDEVDEEGEKNDSNNVTDVHG